MLFSHARPAASPGARLRVLLVQQPRAHWLEPIPGVHALPAEPPSGGDCQ